MEGANSHYLALDGLGSPVALVNQDGGQTGAYAYDPYGGMTATAVNGSGAIGIQVYGYAGGFDDPTSTLVHFGQRWYDPAAGRFTQQDALETLTDPTRANRYEYANSNPINYIDPTGRFSLGDAIGSVAGGLITAGFAAGGTILGGPAVGVASAAVGGCLRGFVSDNLSSIIDDESPSEGDALASCAVGAVTGSLRA